MTKRFPLLALIFVIGVGGIIIAWLLNPESGEGSEEKEPVNVHNGEEKKLPIKTIVEPVEIVWYGHASFKVRSREASVYFDPYKIERDAAADLVLITHDHFDHLDIPSLESVSDGNTTVIGPKAVIQKLPESDFDIREIVEGEMFKYRGFEIKVVPAYNLGKDFHPQGRGVGYILTFLGKKIYHAGDTDFIEEMKNLGSIDVALIPIGGTFTMDEEEAARAVKAIKPRIAIPMHYGTLPETAGDPERFKELVSASAEVRILK